MASKEVHCRIARFAIVLDGNAGTLRKGLACAPKAGLGGINNAALIARTGA